MHRNAFDERLNQATGEEDLPCLDLETLQVNLGLRCNQACRHCHLEASPARTEAMEFDTMDRVLDVAQGLGLKRVDLTGGAPELHPNFKTFVERLRSGGNAVQVRTNLTVLLEPGMEAIPDFFRDLGIQLVASLPCYLEKNVNAQRGQGVYARSVEALRRLNTLGYGIDPAFPLNLVYNPGGPFLPPPQNCLERDYRRELGDRFDISFTRLLTLTNMPLGRFLEDLRKEERDRDYCQLLEVSFNPKTLTGLMCRHQISVAWDGTLYDCDFNLALRLPVNHGAPKHIDRFDPDSLAHRTIVTGIHCLGCTAGAGSSCGGALACA